MTVRETEQALGHLERESEIGLISWWLGTMNVVALAHMWVG
jgi:hypothetical protein